MSAHNGFHFVRVMVLISLTLIWSGLCADTQVFEVWGPTGEGAGIYIKAGDAIITISFPEGTTTNELAQMITDDVNGIGGFTVMRAGNRLYITHKSKITLEKVNISNTRVHSSSYNNGQAQFARNNLFQFTGTAFGDGDIQLVNSDLSLTLPTFAGQTSLQIVDALTDALHAIVPDDGLFSFGMEFCIASLGQPDVPIGSVDLGIWALGNRNLLFTECISTDTGITVFQEAVVTEEIPTLTEWGVIILLLITLTSGTVYIMSNKKQINYVST